MADSRRRPTRVLAYSDSKAFGGAEGVFCEVAGALAARPGLDLVVASPRENERLATALEASVGDRRTFDVPGQALPLAALDLFDPLRLRKVERVIAEAAPDVLLVNLPSAEYGGIPLRSRTAGLRRVGLLHVAGSPRELGFRLGAVREHLARRALASLDAVCVLSAADAETFRRRWDQGGTEIRRLSLPTPRLSEMPRSAARRSLGLSAGRWVGIAGRISIKQKGHDVLVEAARLMLADGEADIRFAVAGEGRDRARLEDLAARRGVGGNFRFLGSVRPIDPFLSAVDALAIPSRFEGLPLIGLEALAAGVPGIASAVDGLRDLWPPHWLVAPGDPGALASALVALLASDSAERSRHLADGRRRMEQMTSDDPAAAVEPLVRL